jgi:hypothetical protein
MSDKVHAAPTSSRSVDTARASPHAEPRRRSSTGQPPYSSGSVRPIP